MENTLMVGLIKIQHELKAPKTQTNAFGKYKYRKAEDILEAVKPLLARENLMLYVTDKIVLIGTRYYVEATAIITDGKQTITVTASAREEEVKKGMDGSQITGASSSYARKYALNGLFLIDDNADSDTTNLGDDTTTAKKQDNKPLPPEVIAEISATRTIVDLKAVAAKHKTIGPGYYAALCTACDEQKALIEAANAKTN